MNKGEEKISTNMPKVEVMDRYLESTGKLKGKEIREAIKDVFGADLNYISEKNYGSKLSIYHVSVMESLRISLNVDSNSTELDAQIMAMTKNEVMDRFMEVHDFSLTGAQIRVLINQIFGVNLDGISGLEHLRISIYSKGLWILQGDTDLFVVSSSLDDVELYVASTDYFEETSGSNQLPDSLKQKLISIGFSYDADLDQFVYRNPTNESVPDAFKGQVIGSVVGTVMEFNKIN
ncbi:MAG: hypothetical protein R3267_01960 [Paenisporosarcina sp.]|nr:hypothetical protein [Paenisporosarcina sp.]